MGFIKRQLLKVIKWDDSSTSTIVYRYPMTDRDEIMNGCELIVTESQVAMLVAGGTIADVYSPGSYKLTTGNMPILTKLASWKYGFESPFKADVYYVNTKQFMNMKWGTASKIVMRDADFGSVRVGARGTYSFKVSDPALFMREIFGTNKDYSTSSLTEYFKSIVVSNFAKVLGEANIPVLDVLSKYVEIGESLLTELEDDFDKIGLKICACYVESIVLPEEVEKAIDRRSSVGVLSDKIDEFTRISAAEAMKEAAGNQGGGMAGAGVGIAAGIALGKTMGESLAPSEKPVAPSPSVAPTNSKTCPDCGTPAPSAAKFCSNCGKAFPTRKFCSNCGKEVSQNAKFCSNCGTAL